MRKTGCIAATAAGLALTFASLARADTALPPDVHDPVAGHPGVTYLDLLRQAIPDLADYPDAKDAEGSLKILRHLAGKDFAGDPPDPVAIDYLEDVRFKSGGRPRVALLASLGQSADSAIGVALLVVFDDAPTPRLLDFADVGLDKDIAFDAHPTFALDAGNDALVTYSEHFNSNETYGARLLAVMRGDKLRLIGVQNTFDDRDCGWVRTETPTFTVHRDAGRALPRTDIAVLEDMDVSDEDCAPDKRPKAYKRTWRGGWRWNAAKGAYQATPGGDLDRLDKINEGRY